MIKGKQFVFLYEIKLMSTDTIFLIVEPCLRSPGPAVMELASDPGQFGSSKYQTSS